jgi:hypothetical protein
MGNDEKSESGNPIFRYSEKDRREVEISRGSSELIEEVERFVSEKLGKSDFVFHEVVSPYVHIDTHHFFVQDLELDVFVTSGMSEKAMNTPPEYANFMYAEMMVVLPHEWPGMKEVGPYSLTTDHPGLWPINQLRYLARFPHEFNTWLAPLHTIPNGDPAQPYASDTKFCCMLIYPSIILSSKGLRTLERSTGEIVNFYSLWPLFPEEVEFKLKHGGDALLEKFADAEISDMFDNNRKNVGKKRWFF